MRIRFVAFSLLIVAVSCVNAHADWPQFRGPEANGLTSASNLPAEWGAEKNIAWKVDLPGVAWSQPIVVGDKIFVTTAETENQRKPQPGFGGFGGPGGRGGRGPRPEGGPPPGAGQPPADEQRPRDGEGQRPPENRPGRAFGGPGGPGGRGFGGFGRAAEPPDAVYRWKVLCLDGGTGNVLWEKLAHEGKPTIATHGSNTYASETPVSDGERIYAYFGMTGLYCYNLAGDLQWEKDLGSFPMMMGWGTGSSPAMHGDKLFVQVDNEEKSFLAALSKSTGDELWRVERDEKSNWSTPYIWKNRARTELVTSGGTKMRSYDPDSGELLWEMDTAANGSANATAVGDADMLYLGTGGMAGGGGPLMAIKAGASGDITLADKETSNAGVAWRIERGGPPMASPLLYEGLLYVVDQRGGVIRCYDAKTGQQHYRERLPNATAFYSSPWASNGKVFCLDDSGQTFVIQAGPELKVLATNKLDDMFWSSVAVAGDKLLLRGVENLYCIAP